MTESIAFGSYDDPVEIQAFALSMVEAALTMELDDSTLPLAYLQAFNASMPGTVYISDEQLDGAVSSAIHNVANGTEEGAMLIQVHDALGWNGWDNETARHALAVSYVAQVSGAEPWLVERLMDASTMEDVAALSNEIVLGTPIGEFPIQLPDALISTFVNPTNDTMLIAMTYTGGEENVGIEYVEVTRDIVSDDTGGTGLRTYVTGTDAIVTDIKASASQDMDRIDPVSIILVLVLIGLFFRSFVTSAIPPASIGIALGLAMTGVYVLGEFVLQIHYSVLTLLLTSMLGAGCDYCIFVLSRYREERLKGLPKKEAVIASVTWAGESITTSGITVMIGFGVLSISRFSMVSSLGICLAMGILIALMVALTFLPSLLMLAGDRVFWPSTIQSIKREMSSLQGRSAKFRHKVGSYFANSARISIRYAKPIVLAAVLISIPATYLVVSMDTSYDFIGTMAPSESREGVEVIQEGFGGGTILPLYVAVQFDSPIVENGSFDTASLVELETLCVELLEDGNVMEVSGPTRPLGEPIDYEDLDSYSDATRAQYMALMVTSISDDGRSALITVTMVDEPLSATSMDTVRDIRSMAEAFSERRGVADVLVAGGTVSMHDISSVVQEDFNLMEVLVVLGIYIVLLIVMGAVFTPVRAIVTILMSISWTLAVTFLVFQTLGGTPILWLMPIVLLVVCLGLGMDYDILLTTRIREEVENGMSTDDAITHAVERTGGVITACGIIMAGAFSTLMLSDSALLQEFGFGLALAILLDATVVRIYLVPSIMHLMGKWNWWAPGRLQKVKIEDVVRTD